MRRSLFLLVILSGLCSFSTAQGFLHVSGNKIVNGSGDEYILRGIGTGNWLLQEGYMMKSEGVAGTQHEFMQKLIQTIGKDRSDAFYTTWLNNHFTRADVDSMKVWGFNSVRVAMHYKWLTLPIENEPVLGQNTWLENGFIRIDSLLKWCSDNQMYLILDLHGAPGGQGHDANISDYDQYKPSLWESADNYQKTVALWRRLAQRYANEPWIGGYDLINEPNWDLPGGTALRQLYVDITNSIRAVDKNHIIIIEGNWFANDFTGLTPPWDNNMVYSGHKYWTYNNPGDLNYLLNLRDIWDVPVWLGESGENSNSWFTSLVVLCETNKVGWSLWPVKKAGINNVLQVSESQNYNNLINFWKTGSPAMTADQTYNAVMEWAESHKISKCQVKYDVIDAIIRQPFTSDTKPFRFFKTGEPIHAVNYDLGRSSYAYKDFDTANYHLNTNAYVAWNKGWTYRNDGVDIENCTDNFPGGNGYSVGWTETGEWMQYTIDADSAAAYTLTVRSASIDALPGIVRFSIDGTDICSPLTLPNTGGWNIWNSTTKTNIIIPGGRNKVRLFFERGGSNINMFTFTDPASASNVPFSFILAETTVDGNEIVITLNKDITFLQSVPGDFQVMVNGNPVNVTNVALYTGNLLKLVISISAPVSFGQNVKISFSGNSLKNGESFLEAFTDKDVKNNLPGQFSVPARIEAEDFYFNNGFKLEDCTDNGGGKNTGFANNGDYLDYLLNVPKTGDYQFLFRIASLYSNSQITIKASTGDNTWQTYGTLSVSATGGWQIWSNQSITVNLPAGNIILRLFSTAGEYNINWFSITDPTGINDNIMTGSLKVYPNPGNGIFRLEIPFAQGDNLIVKVKDMAGRDVYMEDLSGRGSEIQELNLSNLLPGPYIVQVSSPKGNSSAKIIIR